MGFCYARARLSTGSYEGHKYRRIRHFGGRDCGTKRAQPRIVSRGWSPPQFAIMRKVSPKWRYRLGVRTEDSQSSNPGSIPGSATKALLLSRVISYACRQCPKRPRTRHNTWWGTVGAQMGHNLGHRAGRGRGVVHASFSVVIEIEIASQGERKTCAPSYNQAVEVHRCLAADRESRLTGRSTTVSAKCNALSKSLRLTSESPRTQLDGSQARAQR